ncbi:MAG: hypothetical protein ACYC6F_09225 [Longimicrobiales bacterium]
METPDAGRGVRLIRLDAHAWADARGWGLRPFEAVGSGVGRVGDVHVVSLLPGAVRGNHLHPNVTEWLLVLGAPVTVAWRSPEGPGSAYLVSWADGVPESEQVPPLL